MKHRWLAVWLVMTPLQSAQSEAAFPDWNMRKFCSARLSAVAVNDCVQLQNEARQKARSKWNALGAAARRECIFHVTEDTVPPSYMRLDACLDLTMRGR